MTMIGLDCGRLVNKTDFYTEILACKRNTSVNFPLRVHKSKCWRGKHFVLQDDWSNLKSTGFGVVHCNNFLYLTWISFKSLSCIFCKGSIKFCLTSMSRASLTSPSSRMASPTSIRARPVKHKSTTYLSII